MLGARSPRWPRPEFALQLGRQSFRILCIAFPRSVANSRSVRGAQSFVLRGADVIALDDVSGDDLPVNPFEKRNAPAAACPGAETLGDLGSASRPRLFDEVDDFAFLDVEAVAESAFEVHTFSLPSDRV